MPRPMFSSGMPNAFTCPRVHVAQQRKAEFLAVVKPLEYIEAVISHGGDLHADPFEPGAPLFQLNQLGLAEGSPVRGAAQHQQHAAVPGKRFEVAGHAVLVFGLDDWCGAADRRSPGLCVAVGERHARQGDQRDQRASQPESSSRSSVVSFSVVDFRWCPRA